ncbi:MAG: hypothetical protein FWF22_04230 [Treponema sp.]|nr:hypothetical protein [Treponema sp.]
MINGVMSDNSFPAMGFALNVPAGSKAALPVAPSSLIYSHFKHVNGIPAPEGSQGVTISKLNMLDILIEQMGQGKNSAARPDSGTPESLLDSMIDSYRNKMLQANTSMPYSAFTAETGSLFSLTV